MTATETVESGAHGFARWMKTTQGIITSVAVIFGTLLMLWNTAYEWRKAWDSKLDEIAASSTKTEELGGEIVKLTGEIVKLTVELEAERRARGAASEDRASLTERVAALEEDRRIREQPSMRFLEYANHTITDGKPGGGVSMTWHYIVDRTCGRPIITPQIIDGGGFTVDGVLMGFSGTQSPAGKKTTITYRVALPRESVPGRAEGWVILEYPHGCPTVTGPTVNFEILPRETAIGGGASYPEEDN